MGKVEKKAMEIVVAFEKAHSRKPIRTTRCGYDFESSGRFIEVKGVSEINHYTYQGMTSKEVKCVKDYPNKFYLYIVRFNDKSCSDYALYIIPGTKLVSDEFRFRPIVN